MVGLPSCVTVLFVSFTATRKYCKVFKSAQIFYAFSYSLQENVHVLKKNYIYIYKMPCTIHLHDVVKYVYFFVIPFINSICIRTQWKVSYIAVMVSTLPGPKYSSFMDMLLFQIKFWLIISACHFKEIILTYCFISHSQGGFI